MKARLTADGTLVLTPGDAQEAIALGEWTRDILSPLPSLSRLRVEPRATPDLRDGSYCPSCGKGVPGYCRCRVDR